MLVAALGNRALRVELARNTATAAMSNGIERKRVGFGRMPIEAVLVWACKRRLPRAHNAVGTHVF